MGSNAYDICVSVLFRHSRLKFNIIGVQYSVFRMGVGLFCIEIDVLIPMLPVTSNLASGE